ncbi:MAG: GNAT family N-acetyltransferase [Synergistaceae bacterium]|nr:GNAT family N-acetyltransferase [Synergistaceae bacterium]
MITTERLRIYPASLEQMEKFIASETNGDIKKAYEEMLGKCLQTPEQWEWYAMWIIELHDGTNAGSLCFKGIDSEGVTEIGYGILEQYQNQGYATEAVKAVSSWAFKNSKVTAVKAETDTQNKASQRVLEKCGFIADGKIGKEGYSFTLILP